MATVSRTRAEEFVEVFAAGWALGAGDAFFEHFGRHFHPEAVFVQPLAPAMRGEAGLRQVLEPLFAAVPDLRGDVVRWGATDDGVLIELRLHGTFAGAPVAWTTIDSIVLEDGLLRSRTAHFDPLPLLAQFARRPLPALRLLARMLAGRRRRRDG